MIGFLIAIYVVGVFYFAANTVVNALIYNQDDPLDTIIYFTLSWPIIYLVLLLVVLLQVLAEV